jgi:hypothetical protein
MLVAAASPQYAWQEVILRPADTVAAAWTGIQVKRPCRLDLFPPAPPKAKIDLPGPAMVRGPRIRLPPPVAGRGNLAAADSLDRLNAEQILTVPGHAARTPEPPPTPEAGCSDPAPASPPLAHR